MRELYVYYRVPPAAEAAALAAVGAAQAALRAAHPGLVARLLRRDDADGAATWMETYAVPGTPHGVDAALQSAVESACAALPALVGGPRHAEAFVADLPAVRSG